MSNTDHGAVPSWIPGYALPAPIARTLAAVCVPLPEGAVATNGPGGAALRYTPVYETIRNARDEDDPTLPRGEWTRPLKRADWPQVIRTCESALSTRSKDFQLAAWLAEAWTRLYGVDGVCGGVLLFDAMIQQDWAPGHPTIDAGDLDARSGVLMWLRDALAGALTRHVVLLTLPDRVVTLDVWQRLLLTAPGGQPVADKRDDPAQSDDDGAAPLPALTRDVLIDQAKGAALHRLERLRLACGVALALLPGLVERIDAVAGADSPSFERVSLALTGLERAAVSLIDGRIGAADPFTAPDSSPARSDEESRALHESDDELAVDTELAIDDDVGVAAVADADGDTEVDNDVDRDAHFDPRAVDLESDLDRSPRNGPEVAKASSQPFEMAPTPVSTVLETASGSVIVHDRHHAYELIEALANYLSEREPHSPTPYLLMRAASWGPMSLLELMQDITQDEAALQRYFNAIGVK